MDFHKILKDQLLLESSNFYTGNYDYYSRGREIPLKKKVANLLRRLILRKSILSIVFQNKSLYENLFLGKLLGNKDYIDALAFFYNVLEDQRSKDLLLKLVCFRTLGYLKVKLPLNTREYWEGLEIMEKGKIESEHFKLPFKPWIVHQYDFVSNNENIRLYSELMGVYTTFRIHQYRCPLMDGSFIGADEGETVLDLGGCFGDSTLYFSHMMKGKGKVFVFEFIPNNISILRKNIELNPAIGSIVEVVESPVWDKSGVKIFYKDRSSSSEVRLEDFPDSEGHTFTLSIDDFVESRKLERVDFLKTDIEGAETKALIGAEQTIRKFRPKLAISIYHGKLDLVRIVRQIHDMNLGYKFYLNHAKIYASETVLFCVQ